VRAALKAQRNKTERTDALGLAHLMRTGWFRRAHIKSEDCYRLRLLLTHRRNLKRKFLNLENAVRHSLKAFGIRHSNVGRGFAQAVREAVAGDVLVSELIDAMLSARAALWRQYCRLHNLVVKLVAGHALCRRFMQILGVGPIPALSFMTAIDDPSRFKRSRDVAAYFGLTSRRWQSGSSIDVKGRISKAGDPDVRRALYPGGQRAADPLQAQGQGQGLGHGDRQARWSPQGHRCGALMERCAATDPVLPCCSKIMPSMSAAAARRRRARACSGWHSSRPKAVVAQKVHTFAEHRLDLLEIEFPFRRVGFTPILSRTDQAKIVMRHDAQTRAVALERRPAARPHLVGLRQRDPISHAAPISMLPALRRSSPPQ
jgi:transposase IS116/IS110/IS902 family protein